MNDACSSLVGAAAKDGFESATRWISQAGFSSDELEKLSRILPYNVKLGETGQWLEWLGKTLPSGRADDGINRMVSKWTEKDYRAAGTWLASAPDGSVKQTAVQSYAQTVAPYDPQAAVQWALTLPPGEMRQQTLVQIVVKWPREDAAGAEAFAKEHGIKFDPKPQNPY